MGVVTQKLSLERFRKNYVERKPHFELLDGVPVQKSLPTKLHSILQLVLALCLKELGYKSRPELTLGMSDSWEPTPDICGIIGAEEETYPTRPVAVTIEVLSPDDRMSRVAERGRQYAEWGVADILVFDPVRRQAWYLEKATRELASIEDSYAFRSSSQRLFVAEIFERMDKELL